MTLKLVKSSITTVEDLIDELQRVPKDAKVAMLITVDESLKHVSDGATVFGWVDYLTYDSVTNRVTLKDLIG